MKIALTPLIGMIAAFSLTLPTLGQTPTANLNKQMVNPIHKQLKSRQTTKRNNRPLRRVFKLKKRRISDGSKLQTRPAVGSLSRSKDGNRLPKQPKHQLRPVDI